MKDVIDAYPLAWPLGRRRTPQEDRVRARFSAAGRQITVRQALNRVLVELGRLGVGDWNIVVSTNIPTRGNGLPYSDMPEPKDRGVAVYFRLENGADRHCMSCDKWDRVADNLAAIAAHVEAVRGQLRWGVGDVAQVFAGFKALPAVAMPQPSWWEVLGFVARPQSVDKVLDQHRRLAAHCHPDHGGSTEQMAEINAARDAALRELEV